MVTKYKSRHVDSKNQIFIKYNFKITSKSDQYVGIKKFTDANWRVTETTDWVCDTYMQHIMFALQAFLHFWILKQTFERVPTCTPDAGICICENYN